MLTFNGGGSFSNTENLTLNDQESSLKLNGISEVSKVLISADLVSGKLQIAENSIISTLVHTGSSRVYVENDKALTVSNSFEIPNGQTMKLLGSGDTRTINLPDLLTLSGTLEISSTGYNISSGTLGLSGGLLEI